MSAPALRLDTHAPGMPVASDLLGPLDARTDLVLEMPRGLFGFPECRRWVLADAGRDGLYWMQSVDHASLAFLLADPFAFVPEYTVDLGPAALAELRAQSPTDVAVFAIVTLPGPLDPELTVNLQGPIVLNMSSRRGVQIVVPDGPFGVRQPVTLRDAR
jgi:flagellar assembly factor FliW